MKIAFHGAARHVTGSKHLLELSDGTKVLLDCGLFQGMGEGTDDLNSDFGFEPSQIDYLVLSHAHIDHSGLIPRLVASGFEGTIFSTAATMDLCRILLNDSAHIQEQDAYFVNKQRFKRGEHALDPLYTQEDVMKALGLFKIVEYEEEYDVSPRIKLRFTDAGHILGSAAIHLDIIDQGKSVNITFSGDIGRYEALLLRNPSTFRQADYIVMESTYGDSLHKAVDDTEDKLLELIHQTCVLRKGKLIIPAFSVGRTQELLYALNALDLKGSLPDVPYYVDSPLSENATNVLKEHTYVYNKDVQNVLKKDDDIFSFKGLKFIQSVEESKSLNDDPRPCVIISSSGMAEAGRIRHHIKNTIENEKNTILIVGYCEPSSLGGRLLAGDKVVRVFGDEYLVRADVQSIHSMSAHGDVNDLLKFLSCQNPGDVKKLFLVHGEYNVQKKFSNTLLEEGFRHVVIPDLHEIFDLE